MDKELLEKLREVLGKHGIEEEVISEVEKELSEETPAEEPEVEEVVEEESAAPEPVEGEEGDEPSQDEVTPPAEEPVAEEGEPAPIEEPVEEPAEEIAPEETPAEEPLPEGIEEVDPAIESSEMAPTDNSGELEDLRSELKEQRAANEGLKARIDALEDALKKAGVMGESDEGGREVGIDDGTRTPDFHDDEDDLDAVVASLNRNRY